MGAARRSNSGSTTVYCEYLILFLNRVQSSDASRAASATFLDTTNAVAVTSQLKPHLAGGRRNHWQSLMPRSNEVSTTSRVAGGSRSPSLIARSHEVSTTSR